MTWLFALPADLHQGSLFNKHLNTNRFNRQEEFNQLDCLYGVLSHLSPSLDEAGSLIPEHCAQYWPDAEDLPETTHSTLMSTCYNEPAIISHFIHFYFLLLQNSTRTHTHPEHTTHSILKAVLCQISYTWDHRQSSWDKAIKEETWLDFLWHLGKKHIQIQLKAKVCIPHGVNATSDGKWDMWYFATAYSSSHTETGRLEAKWPLHYWEKTGPGYHKNNKHDW